MSVKSRYVRCAAIGCYGASEHFPEDIPLCAEHEQRLRDRFAPVVFTEALGASRAVVYYVAWRKRPDVVKIGTTTNLRKRLHALSTTSDRAKVLVAEPGSYYLERARHRQFSHLRIAGDSELFKWVPEVAAHIAAVREQVGWVGTGLEAADLPIVSQGARSKASIS